MLEVWMRVVKIILLVVFAVLTVGMIAGSLIVRSVATKAVPDYNATLTLKGLR